jgi:hypothetical protein
VDKEKIDCGKEMNRFSHVWVGVIPFCLFNEMGPFMAVNDQHRFLARSADFYGWSVLHVKSLDVIFTLRIHILYIAYVHCVRKVALHL